MPPSLESLPALAVDDDPNPDIPTHDAAHDEESESESEIQLSDQQLRDIYDDEEIRRFINLFSAVSRPIPLYMSRHFWADVAPQTVTEIRMPDTPRAEDLPVPLEQEGITCVRIAPSLSDSGEHGDGESQSPSERQSASATHADDLCRRIVSVRFNTLQRYHAHELVQRYLVPYIPPQPMPQQAFTLGRLRIATQRLYLATEPAYLPFLADLLQLATWRDRGRSIRLCIVGLHLHCRQRFIVKECSYFGSCGTTISSFLPSYCVYFTLSSSTEYSLTPLLRIFEFTVKK
jgi:hypothetical protein